MKPEETNRTRRTRRKKTCRSFFSLGFTFQILLVVIWLCVHHVPLLSQTCGCFDGNHQKRHSRRWLRGQVHCQKVSFPFWCGSPTGSFSLLSLNRCLSPLGATGASTATTPGRQSISFRYWSPPTRGPSSLTWRALTASCLCLSLTDRHRHRRRVSSKAHEEAAPVLLVRFCYTRLQRRRTT